jgi:hypothetical protein
VILIVELTCVLFCLAELHKIQKISKSVKPLVAGFLDSVSHTLLKIEFLPHSKNTRGYKN